MTLPALDSRSLRMLELLAQGATSKQIAADLGYQDGTMRVYLHNLYRKLGVANKTAAVIWYMKREGNSPGKPEHPAVASRRLGSDLVGDMALAEGLYPTLGVMACYVGPYSRVWEAGAKASGEDPAVDTDGARARTLGLWKTFLRGDFAAGKAMYDADDGYAVLAASASDGVLLASLLVAGGYSHAATQLTSKLVDRRRSRPAISAREAGLIEAAFEAFEGKDPANGLARLQKAVDGNLPAPFRHLAIALLFYASRARHDFVRARHAANELWEEAQSAAAELKAAGSESSPTASKRSPSRASREKAAAG